MSTATAQLLAQETVDRRMGLYCFGVSTHMIGLFDSGNGKKFLFQYDVQSNVISMNERRAQIK